MDTNKKNYLKFTSALILCLLLRLIPFRVPNVEPILAATMPMGRAFGALAALSFAVLSILSYDVITGTLGVQTFFTVLAYGTLGIWSASYFRKNKAGSMGYLRFAIIGTLFYDALTGLTVGPIFFNQPFMAALVGQIPFTALHLLGNSVFAVLLSPAIDHFLIRKKKKENREIISTLNPKTI